eukprot:8740312-Heterocapsa_arctica.AAC.1
MDDRHVLCLSTDVTGSNFVWLVVEVLLGHMRLPISAPGVEPPRSPLPGVDGDAVSWLCVPPDAGTQLNPT